MHKVVAIGDSLAMGFSSGAIYDTSTSFPSMIAEALKDQDFQVPVFNDHENPGGIPFNLEYYTRILSDKYKNGLNPFTTIGAVFRLQRMLDKVETFWERGPGSEPLLDQPPCHNLAVLTFGIDETYRLTDRICTRTLGTPKDHHVLFHQIPEIPMYRALKRVLNPSDKEKYRDLSVCDHVNLLSEGSGIENLIIFLGSNNCLGPIIDMELRYSEESDLYRFPHERRTNLWLPQHFLAAMNEFEKRINQIDKENVFIATVPHITIPPISRGEGAKTNGYFDYYTRPWIWDSVFDPSRDASILREEAKQIDEIIDEYNEIIISKAHSNGWRVVDICSFLDSTAVRRRGGNSGLKWPDSAVDALKNIPRTAYLVKPDGRVYLDTRYLRVDEENNGRLRAGGLFSLDGLHPTTTCYGLIADVFLKEMKDAGVKTTEGDIPSLNWERIIESDNLITSPPAILSDLRKFLEFISSRKTGHLMLRLLETFKSSVN